LVLLHHLSRSGSVNLPIYVRFSPTSAQSYSDNISHNSTGATSRNVNVSGNGITTTTPTIAVNPNSIEFGNVTIGQSVNRSYFVSGSNLTSVLNIQVPVGAFRISTNSGSDWTNSLTLSGSNINQNIYIKFCPTFIQQYPGSIIHTSSGASSTSLSINGSGIFAQLTEQTSISIIGVSSSSVARRCILSQAAHRIQATFYRASCWSLEWLWQRVVIRHS